MGSTPLSDGLSRSIALIASSTSVPMVGCGALAFRCDQRASFGTQKMFCGAVLVRILRVGALRLLRFEFGVLGLEGVGDVLEEDQAEDDVLVLGRVHVVAERVGGGPELGLEAEVGGVVAVASFCFRHACILRVAGFEALLGRRMNRWVVTACERSDNRRRRQNANHGLCGRDRANFVAAIRPSVCSVIPFQIRLLTKNEERAVG